MKYILDFDHTLFDTTALRKVVAEKNISNVATPEIWSILNAADFLYEDTLSFLRSHRKEDIHILTAITPSDGPQAEAYQKTKLLSSGVEACVDGITFMIGDKGPYIEELYDGTPTVFVDDKTALLLSAKEYCPEVHCVQMLRLSAAPDPRRESHDNVPVVHTLLELDAMIETL